MPPAESDRRYDLDWLRVSAFLILILYHVGMYFVSWGWHLKNPRTAGAALEVPMYFVAQWRLWLLFLVSGAAVRLALRTRAPGHFIRDRLVRLLIPLVFGILVVVPPQIYFERLTQGAGYSSYLDYLPHSLSGGAYPEGNISWHHLWFIAYVLVYSVIALPLLLWLRTDGGSRMTDRLAEVLERPFAILLLAVPIVASEMTLRPAWESTHNLTEDWANLVSFLIVFVYGYVIYSRDRIGEAIAAQRRRFLVMGIASSTTLIVLWQVGLSPDAPGYTPHFIAWVGAKACNTWFWLLTLIGYSRRYLNFGGRLLRRATEAVYPYYILHQTVIVGIAYYLIPWDSPVPVKFVALTVATIAMTTALYLVVRTNPITRVLFGMKASTSPGNGQ